MRKFVLVFVLFVLVSFTFANAAEYKKVTEKSLEVTKQETVTKVNTYNYDFLIKQKADIEKNRDDYISARNVEIAEVDALLAKCADLGIGIKVEEPIEEPVV